MFCGILIIFTLIYRENKDTTARSLDEYEIISFVNENLTLDILQRWLSATNMTKLRDQNSLRVLQRFVRGSLIVNYDLRDTDATKSLDKITKKNSGAVSKW